MAKNNKTSVNKANKDIKSLDTVAKKLLSSIDDSYNERTILSDKNSRMQRIINDELQLSKGISHGSIIDFVASISRDDMSKNNKESNVEIADALFTKDIGNLFGYFQEQYKNRYIEYTDLRFVSKFIPALGEAVKTTLENIVGTDDFSTTITRTLEFGGGLNPAELVTAKSEIERLEKDYKLHKKLKNVVYKNGLVSGTYYVYAVAYDELFTEYQNLVSKGKINTSPLIKKQGIGGLKGGGGTGFNISSAKESYGETQPNVDVSAVLEAATISTDTIMESMRNTNEFDKNELDTISKALEGSGFNVVESDYLLEALEGVASTTTISQNLGLYANSFGGSAVVPDGKFDNIGMGATYDMNGKNVRKPKFNTKGTYVKYIDANHIVPVTIFNQTIGYFHVLNSTVNKKNIKAQAAVPSSGTHMLPVTSNIFNSMDLTEKKKDAAIRAIVDTISEGILTKFSNKFVNKNAQFKNLIADCIIANGMVNNDFQIQFIPANHMVQFVINETEDGRGESILQDSLFPAKMLLSLVVSKLLTYMNKSGNKTIAHIKKGPINVNSSNHVQRVIRMLQESQITFSDLLSTNLTFSKFSRDGNIQLPSAKNGDRLVDFENMEGQQVDMKPEMEEWLEKMAIMGTGVPSVIMEYSDAADYAKSIVTANIKFAGRVASLQADLEEPTTSLYKILIQNSNMEEELKLKVLSDFEFKLPRPKVLTNQNIADYVQTIQGSAQTLADVVYGTNDGHEDNKNFNKEKDEFIKLTVKDSTPFIDWEAIEDRVKLAKLNVIEKNKIEDEGGDDTSSEDDLGI